MPVSWTLKKTRSSFRALNAISPLPPAQTSPPLAPLAPALLSNPGKCNMMQMTRTKFRHGAASLLALWSSINQVRVGHSFSSAGCTSETILCYADEDCGSCLTALDETSDTINPDFTDCNVLFASVCTLAADNGCTVTNTLLEDFAECIAAEQFGCQGFVSCAGASADADAASTAFPSPAVATPAPAAVTSAPTSTEDVSVTSSPSGSGSAAESGTASSGVAHTVAESMKTTLALVLGLAILLSA